MRYRAFFSYSRYDDRSANWLHGQIDRYRTPKSLVGAAGALGAIPAKLHPVFRDRTDMSSGGELTTRIEEALNDSATLIVLCSPAAAASPWVDREIQIFSMTGRPILPVIAADLPDSADVEADFFPPSLRGRGLLAADLREIRRANGSVVGDGRSGGRLKLLAGLLGAPLDALAQRERRRQRALMATMTAALVTFAGVAGAAGWFAYNASVAREATFNVLARGFADRAWGAIQEGDHLLATKYALSGLQSSPRHEDAFRAVMARIAHDMGSGQYWSTPDDPSHGSVMSNDGSLVALDYARGCEVRRAETWELVSTIEACRHEAGGGNNHVEGLIVRGREARLLMRTYGPEPALWLFDANTGVQIARREVGVSEVFLLSDGQSVVYSASNSVHRLNMVSGEGRQIAENATLAVSRDGAAYAALPRNTIGSNRPLRVWDAETDRIVFERDVRAIHACLDAENGIIVAANYDQFSVWSFRTGVVVRTFEPTAFDINANCTIAFDEEDLTAWHIPSGRQLPQMVYEVGDPELYVDANGVFGLIIEELPIRAGFATHEQDLLPTAPAVFHMAGGRLIGRAFGHAAPVDAVNFYASGMVTTDLRGVSVYRPSFVPSVLLRDDFSMVRDTLGGNDNGLVFVGVSGLDARGNDPGQVRRVLLHPQRPPEMLPTLQAPGEALISAALSEDMSMLATGTRSGRIIIWDHARNSLVRTISGHSGAVEIVSFVHDEQLLSVDTTGAVRLSNSRTGALLSTFTVERDSYRRGALTRSGATWGEDNKNNIAINEDARLIATALDSDTITLWGGATGERLREFQDTARVNALSLLPDGALLISGNNEGQIKVWDTASGSMINTFISRRTAVSALAVSRSGRLVASGGYDGSVRVWDRATGQLLLTLEQMTAGIDMLAFSTAGDALIIEDQVGIMAIRTLPYLDAEAHDLRTQLCAMLRAPAARRFSSSEIAADGAIDEVWQRNARDDDVCAEAANR